MNEAIIGIDPGINNGFAIWIPDLSAFQELSTLTIWEVFEELERLDKIYHLQVHLEWPSGNRPTFRRKDQTAQAMEKISQDVGKNKYIAELIAQFMTAREIPFQKHKPGKGSMTKLNSERFASITGYKSRCSQHARDAAMLVWSRKWEAKA